MRDGLIMLCVGSNLVCVELRRVTFGLVSCALDGVYHLLRICAIFHLFHVPSSSCTYFLCLRLLKFNHPFCEPYDRSNGSCLICSVVVGDADGIAAADGVALVVPDIAYELCVLLLTMLLDACEENFLPAA